MGEISANTPLLIGQSPSYTTGINIALWALREFVSGAILNTYALEKQCRRNIKLMHVCVCV